MSVTLYLRCNSPGCTYRHKVPKDRVRMVESMIRDRGSIGLHCPRCDNNNVTVYGKVKHTKKGG